MLDPGSTVSAVKARLASHLTTSQRGLTTLEYVIAAGIILVVLAAAILAWNTGLAERITELIGELLSG